MQDGHAPRLFRFARGFINPVLTDRLSTRVSRCVAAACVTLALSMTCGAQSSSPANDLDTKAALQGLQSQIHELKQLVVDLQQQTADSREEIKHLREELAVERSSPHVATDEQSPAATVDARLDQIEENEQLLSSKLDTQYQTKVESASKYRVRLSGIVLFNLFGNSGSVDNQDIPGWAIRPDPMASSGSVGGTLRQSIIGVEAFGPDLLGAHTSASVNMDFGGGFPAVDNGVNFGLMRLRTAAVRLDWKNTSVIAGQDQLFLAPDSPTSFASVTVPPLGYSGNLWTWTPQLRVEHRFALSDNSSLSLQGALMDPLAGEPPEGVNYVWYRPPGPGEQSRQPAYAARVSYSHPLFGHNATIGGGGYYSRQNWGFNRDVNAWAGTLDALLPLGEKFSLSGAFYRGAAIGGLGGALGRSVIWNGFLSNPNSEVHALNAVGGWAQLKYRATSKLEFNGAYGQDTPFAGDVRYFGDQSFSYVPAFFTTNRSAFGNVIYRPRSDLVFSAEYRRLRTFTIYDNSYRAGQLNMSMGVLF